ncbi:MAG: DUF3016 domain-containing protein [Burkholderiales bacterium]|nr:DUF3016 domain-containing protein [Burkholderiales bacterium]
MKKLLLVLSVMAVCSGVAQAGEAKLNWGKFDDFTDIVPSHESKEMFRETIQKEFAAVFNHLAKKLPDGFELEVTVTDIDLAGDIRPGMWLSTHEIRVMKEIYWPRMNFSFELRNEKKEVIATGKEELRDMDYLRRVRIPSGNTSFEFEEKMIQDWFKKQIATGNFPSKEGVAVAGK